MTSADSTEMTMSTLVIKNLPEALHVRLKEQAERNRRSVTKEVVTLIETGLEGGRAPIPLPPLVKLRGGRKVTIGELEAAIAEGQE
jgi:plasmid stability protein